MHTPNLKLFYAPRTRARTVLWLLEELGRPYALESFTLSSGRHKTPEYLALNPMGKVPLVIDRGRPVAEAGAIAIYLADLYPEASLAPGLDDPERPDYLRWCFFASAIMEPTFGEKIFGWTLPSAQLAWGSYAQMLNTLTEALAEGPWLLGAQFSAADVLVGSNVAFGVQFGLIPNEGPLGAYLARFQVRPAWQRAAAIEARESARFPMASS
jgi:glutathione S-transferase